jgi:hypothetical protein
MSSAGYVDAWIDFNADGDWDDPGEQVLTSARFTEQSLTQTFMIGVPATAPVPNSPTQTFARFRSSTLGGLIPTELAADGEVEDYQVTLLPGTPPTAIDDNYTFNEDNLFSTNDPTGNVTPGFTIDDGVAANDQDPEGGTFQVVLVQEPSSAEPGSFTLFPNGTFTYRPLANFNGQDVFKYRVIDGALVSNNIGTVTLTVRQVNDAPIALGEGQTIDEDVVIEMDQSVLLANDTAGPSNESGQTLNVTGVQATSAMGGTVTLVAGQIRYVPPSNFSGTDTFEYTITDNGTTSGVPAPLSAVATYTVTVLDKNDPPIMVHESASTEEDTPLVIDAALLSGNDSPGPTLPGGGDESNQTATLISVTPLSSAGGTVTLSGGQVTYTPPLNFEGTDTFFYQVQDDGTSGGQSDPQTSTGTVTVTVAGIDDTPFIGSPLGTVNMVEDDPAKVIDLAAFFVDPDSGDTLTFSVVSNSNPSLATPTINGNQLTLALLANANGTADIVIRATDSGGGFVEDTLRLVVGAGDDAPVLVQEIPDMTVNENSVVAPITLSPTYFFDADVLANGDTLLLEVVGNSNPLLVTPTISGNQLLLSLGSNRSGFSDIRISATDAAGNTVIDQFRLTVAQIDDVPLTKPDEYSVRQGELLTTTDPRGTNANASDDGVLANDSDPEGADMTAVLVTGPQFASQFVLNDNGTFSYRHNFGSGKTTDTFTYRASDGVGQSVITTVTITINDPPPPPHRNPADFLDVNADGFLSPIDALLIINYLNEEGAGPVTGLTAPPPYRDVDGDNFISAIDVLQVINALNDLSAGGSGEGEGSGLLTSPLAATNWNSTNTQFASRASSEALAAAFAPLDVLSSNENMRYSMQDADPSNDELLLPGNDRDPHSNLNSSFDYDPQVVETNWVGAASEQDDWSVPVDLALASLLDDFESKLHG